jgi:hypothetical protein
MKVQPKTLDQDVSHKIHTQDFIAIFSTKQVERSMVEAIKLFESASSDYKKAIEIYEEFKRLRAELGKPIRVYKDREEIIKDLQGEEFLPVVRDIERKRSSDRRRTAFR